MSTFDDDYLRALAAAGTQPTVKPHAATDFTFADLKVGDAFFFPDAPMTDQRKGPWIKTKAKSFANAYTKDHGTIAAPKQVRVTPIFKYAARVYAVEVDKKRLMTSWTGNKNFTTDDTIILDAIPRASTLLYRYHMDGTWADARFNAIRPHEEEFIRKLPDHYTGSRT